MIFIPTYNLHLYSATHLINYTYGTLAAAAAALRTKIRKTLMRSLNTKNKLLSRSAT